MYFYAKHSDPKLLSKFFKSFENIIEYCNLRITSNGLIIKAMDSSHTSIIESTISIKDFSIFKLDDLDISNYNELILGVNLNSFCKIMSTAEQVDSVVFELKYKTSDILKIKFENKSRKCGYKLKLLDINNEDIDIVEMNYDLELDLCIKRFMKIIQNIEITNSDNIIFKSNQENSTICLIGNGEIADVNILLKDSSESPGKILKIRKSDKSLSLVDREKECILKPFKESVDLQFSLESIKKISKISQIVDRVVIKLAEDTPLKLEFKPTENSFINYYIAPKISD